MRNIISAAIILAMLGMVYVTVAFRESSRDLRDSVMAIGQKRGSVNTAHTEWTSGGLKVSVDTTRADGESDTAWAARHKASVAAFLLQFPKDG